MRTTLHRIGSLSVALAIVALLSVRAQAQLQTPLTVYITNITQGQILSPVVVVTHRAGAAPLFTPGEPASDELAVPKAHHRHPGPVGIGARTPV